MIMYKHQFTHACHYQDTLTIPAIFEGAELLPPLSGVPVGLGEGEEVASSRAKDEVEELTMTGEGEGLVVTEEVEVLVMTEEEGGLAVTEEVEVLVMTEEEGGLAVTEEVDKLAVTEEVERLVMTDEMEGSGSGWASASVQ